MLALRYSTCAFLSVSIVILLTDAAANPDLAQESDAAAAIKPLPLRIKVPGRLRLNLQTRDRPTRAGAVDGIVISEAEWNVAETAIIICDMWSEHPCRMSAERVDAMAARMNEVVSAARSHGVMIIHAPSGGTKYYEDTPYRQRMKQVPHVEPPMPIRGRERDPAREPPLPVTASGSIDACDDPDPRPDPDFDRHQHPAIRIIGYDGLTASGQEVYNFCVAEGIKNIAIMGVHTNMCVLGRPFGIRQMSQVGMKIVLVRDLTDAMYDPRDPPFVSHTRGTEMIIEHIETYWCPSILAEDLTRVIPETAGPATMPAGAATR
jgi:nicotinamidase-related amidase